MGLPPGHIFEVWLLPHVALAILPPALWWAHRRRWRITLLDCFILLTLGAVAASRLAAIVRQMRPEFILRILLDPRTLLTSSIVFVASALITLIVWARARAKAGDD